jgi:hypothetical protein
LNPVSNLKIKKSKSYLSPIPDPTAISFNDFRLLKIAFGSSTSSRTFQIFPASIKKAPSSLLNNLYLCSKLNANLKFASLNSLLLSDLPGPRLYAVHALLSFDPPAKKLFENGIVLELPIGIAIPIKVLSAITLFLPRFHSLI